MMRLNMLKRAAPGADVTMSVCTGAFVAARAGLFVGLAATTHHGGYDAFAQMFPRMRLVRGVKYVENATVSSSGGETSGIDLALRVVERYYGAGVARSAAYNMEYRRTARPQGPAEVERSFFTTLPDPGAPARGRAESASTVGKMAGVLIHLVDGTYELFRHYYALPSALDEQGREVAAVRGVLTSIRGMLEGGATHVGVATDHVIESFRNALWPGYKTGEGIDPALFAQFPLLEEALIDAGIVVWPMVEFEADDALASAAALAAADPRVERVIICTPDKDLAQCVRGTRVVQLNRRTRTFFDEAGIVAKFGVPPESIPDYLALVGDAADGFPGLPGWGAKSAAAVLARYGHIESVPADPRAWTVNVASPVRLAQTLQRDRELALLFRHLATLRSDIALFDDVDALRWTGQVNS